MPFGIWTRLGASMHLLDGVQIPTREEAILRGKVAAQRHPRTAGSRTTTVRISIGYVYNLTLWPLVTFANSNRPAGPNKHQEVSCERALSLHRPTALRLAASAVFFATSKHLRRCETLKGDTGASLYGSLHDLLDVSHVQQSRIY